ncbi:hypothetical protein EJB05_22370, partial [Eragrostis curvula]
MAGQVCVWFIPLHFSFAFLFPLQRFLQCQSKKNFANAFASAAALCIHIFVSWLFISKLRFGLVGIALTLNFSWWATALMLFAYVSCGGCSETWNGFSIEAFTGMWEFVKLSSASGVMLCFENWYYRILILLTGNLKNAAIAVDALSICMTINGWEMMIPMAFFAGAGDVVRDAVDNLSILLAFTILLNSIQPVLSGGYSALSYPKVLPEVQAPRAKIPYYSLY